MSEPNNVPRIALTIAEAADEARVSPRTIANWISSGRLRSTKIVGVRRIIRDDLRRLLAGGYAGVGSTEDSLEMPTGELIERATLEAIAGKQNVAALIELGKLRYAVGRVLKRDVEAIFSKALR